ncbi:hypothetical protein SDRG_02602 [Saprolegnia diclina VS20]|uniref:Uncharacterized protein n=1 Tax=Saprolegnia diclina (strain VS20) TaxID=1156394 RepID=T0QZ27_SAPDV|nr:hypothetical protein SDRG_02602 [Saprolegnia diclina VS20]EQC39946.1 hypothetical protein SDRG_02602 [Saprolegnia diclina VS20]|eukprot:XP_008606420.1 hypothetical protein SDRG_02602 [Saprolegnia diclina VS20]
MHASMELPSITSHKKMLSMSAIPLQLEPLGYKPKQGAGTVDRLQQFDPQLSPPKYKLEKLSAPSPVKDKEPDAMVCRKQHLQAIAPSSAQLEKSVRHSSHGFHHVDASDESSQSKDALRTTMPHLQHLPHD